MKKPALTLESLGRTVKHLLLGRPRDLSDPTIHHRLSLIPFLAWVGLGADGLSSSAYGPEEAFRALGEHTYLAVGLALMTTPPAVVPHVGIVAVALVGPGAEPAALVTRVGEGFGDGLTTLGMGGMLLLFARAYAMGGGTYTGIEAVSNGLAVRREPRVQTGKRTMLYMACLWRGAPRV